MTDVGHQFFTFFDFLYVAIPVVLLQAIAIANSAVKTRVSLAELKLADNGHNAQIAELKESHKDLAKQLATTDANILQIHSGVTGVHVEIARLDERLKAFIDANSGERQWHQ